MKFTEVLNLSNDDYHNSDQYKDYWSSSNLKNYLASPREALFQKSQKKEPTPDMQLGTAIHDFLASKHIKGQKFEYNFFEPPINKSTGEYYGKSSKAYQECLSSIKNPISVDDMQLINDLWSMIRGSSYAWYFEQYILSKGVAEPSYFVESGIHRYKYRPDVLTDFGIYDYKTIGKILYEDYSLAYRIKDLSYDISAAMYQYFEHARTGIWKPFYIVWLMKEPPYDILIENISRYCFEPIGDNEVIVNSGANVFLKLKEQHELCQVSGNWPGIANKFDIFRGVRIKEVNGISRNFDYFDVED